MSLVDDGVGFAVGVIAWQSPPVRNRWLVPWMHPELPPSEWDASAARHWVAEHLPRPVVLVPGPFTAFDARAQRILVLDDPHRAPWVVTLELFHEWGHAAQPRGVQKGQFFGVVGAILGSAWAMAQASPGEGLAVWALSFVVVFSWRVALEWTAEAFGIRRLVRWRHSGGAEQRWLARVSRRRRVVMLWDAVWPRGAMFPLLAFVVGQALRPL